MTSSDRPAPSERPVKFQLTHFGAGNFDSESACNSAPTNCKANYFGTNETDPFVSKKPCKQLLYDGVTKWYNICEMRANRIQGDVNWSKFAQEFKPTVSNFPKAYLDFITPFCAKNHTHGLCKDNIFNMQYNKNATLTTNNICNQTIVDNCKHGKYGGGDTDPVYNVPAQCIRDPEDDNYNGFNYQYPWCTLQSHLIQTPGYANAFHTDFDDTPNVIGRDFLLSSYCDKNPYEDICRDRIVLFEEKTFNTLDECKADWDANPSDACVANFYDNSDWLAVANPCNEIVPGEFRHACYAWTNVDLTDRDAGKLSSFFNREVDSPNEITYSLLMRPYCSKPENKRKSACITNSSSICRSEPWRTTCGGDGNKCTYTPTAPECNSECTTKPWMTICGGDGNACPYDQNAPGCEQCKTQPWLELCGGDGNNCPFQPEAPGCSNPCTSQPWLVECGGDGDKCKYNPDLPECENSNPDPNPDPDPCTTQPWLLSCGGSGNRCDYNSTYPECTTDGNTIGWIALIIAAVLAVYVIMKKRG